MRKPTAIAAVIAAISAGALALAMGPLNPPPGPVAETTPSLADLKADLDQLIVSNTGTVLADGPFMSFRSHTSGDFTTTLTSQLVTTGPVYVHEIIVYRGNITIFEGPGAIDSAGRSLTTNWVARNTHFFTTSGSSGLGQINAVSIPVRQIVTGDLHAAWVAGSQGGYANILYTPLTAGATE